MRKKFASKAKFDRYKKHALAALSDPDEQGPVPGLLELLAPHLVRALGPDLKTFQAGRRERVLPGAGSPVRGEVAAWVGALGLGEFDLYLSPINGEQIVALATEPVSIIVGARVSVGRLAHFSGGAALRLACRASAHEKRVPPPATRR